MYKYILCVCMNLCKYIYKCLYLCDECIAVCVCVKNEELFVNVNVED